MADPVAAVLPEVPPLPDDQVVKWYVMRVYKQEMRVEREFREAGFEAYVPKRHVVKKLMRHGRLVPVVKEQLAMTGYVFVHSSRERIQPFKQPREHIRWAMEGDAGKRVFMTVKDKQMEDFIAVTNQMENAVQFYMPEQLSSLKVGSRVRLIGGHLNGVEGSLVSLRGSRNKRLIVTLDGIGGASVDVLPELVQLLG